jgi:N-acetylmuramoyl-L-alanine amidase
MEIQTAWAAMGDYEGEIDGIWGDQSYAAAFASLKRAGWLPPQAPDALIRARELVGLQPVATRPIDEIDIHCTAGFNPSTAAGLRQMHMTPGWEGSKDGWSDLGYHYVIRTDGTIERGRPEAQIGAHIKGHNPGKLAIVYVGGVGASGTTAGVVPMDTRTAQQRDSLEAIVTALCEKYPAIKKCKGHNDYTNKKACPSFKVGDDHLSKIPKEVNG